MSRDLEESGPIDEDGMFPIERSAIADYEDPDGEDLPPEVIKATDDVFECVCRKRNASATPYRVWVMKSRTTSGKYDVSIAGGLILNAELDKLHTFAYAPAAIAALDKAEKYFSNPSSLTNRKQRFPIVGFVRGQTVRIDINSEAD